MIIDEYLKPFGVNFDELSKDERDWVLDKVKALTENQVTVEKIKEAIHALKTQCEQELTNKKDSPQNFLSLLCLLIPLVGIIRKWYQDQNEVELRAKLKCYISLETIITAPERQKKEIDRALAHVAKGLG